MKNENLILNKLEIKIIDQSGKNEFIDRLFNLIIHKFENKRKTCDLMYCFPYPNQFRNQIFQ
jgi:hypothetical protein